MPRIEAIATLNINKMTRQQYLNAVAANQIGPADISLLTDVSPEVSTQVTIMPEASAEELNKIYQYVGVSGEYTNGYFYKCIEETIVEPESLIPYDLVVSYGTGFEALSIDATSLVTALSSATGWNEEGVRSVLPDSYWKLVWNKYVGSIANARWGYTGTMYLDASILNCFNTTVAADPSSYIDIEFYSNYTPGSTTVAYRWERIDVQPASSPSYPSTMPVLLANAWVQDQVTGEITQTLSNVQGVTANSVLIISPSPASAQAYADSEVLCIAQGNGTLTFKCEALPSEDITVTVICF